MRLAALICLVLALALALFISDSNTPASIASAAPQEKWIHIDLVRKALTLYEGNKVLKTYGIASGTAENPSPIGSWRVSNRFSSKMSGFGTRFLGLNVPWGQFGIHGTNKPGSIGTNASHGCIRMYVKSAEELYRLVPNGTRVIIEGGPYGALDSYLPVLVPGERSSHVREVQQRLNNLGFSVGNPDGVYGAGTSRAVLQAREAYGLPKADRVDAALYNALGIILFE